MCVSVIKARRINQKCRKKSGAENPVRNYEAGIKKRASGAPYLVKVWSYVPPMGEFRNSRAKVSESFVFALMNCSRAPCRKMRAKYGDVAGTGTRILVNGHRCYLFEFPSWLPSRFTEIAIAVV